jgi:ribose transport system substrate-binding protein
MKSRISLILLVALALSACATPTAVPAVPPTAVPPTAVPPTAMPAPATAAPVAAAPSSQCDRSKDLYVYGTVLASIDFFQDTKNGLLAAEKDLGVKTKFVGPTDYNMDALLQAIDQAIAEKPAGIILLGWEESMVPEINKAVDAGIPVVTTTGDQPTSKRLFFIGADNYQWGVAMGKKLIEMTGGTGTYAVLRDPNLANITQRFNGLTDYIKANSELQMVAEENRSEEHTSELQSRAI